MTSSTNGTPSYDTFLEHRMTSPPLGWQTCGPRGPGQRSWSRPVIQIPRRSEKRWNSVSLAKRFFRVNPNAILSDLFQFYQSLPFILARSSSCCTVMTFVFAILNSWWAVSLLNYSKWNIHVDQVVWFETWPGTLRCLRQGTCTLLSQCLSTPKSVILTNC